MRTLSACLVIFTLALATVGCDPEPTHYWFNPMRSLEQAKTDCQECRERVETAKAEATRLRQSQDREKPLSAEGEQELDKSRLGEQVWDEVYLESIFAGCMGGKGYFKVELDRLPRDIKTKSLPGGDVAGR